MLQEWEGVELKMTPYKDSGTCIVGGVDDVQTILDDQIVKIQAISASPFVAPFRERASGHEATLQTLQVPLVPQLLTSCSPLHHMTAGKHLSTYPHMALCLRPSPAGHCIPPF